MVAIIVHHVVGGDERRHVSTCLRWQFRINLPIVALAFRASYGLVERVGAAVVCGDDEIPVSVCLVKVAEIVGGSIRRLHDVAPLIDQ